MKTNVRQASDGEEIVLVEGQSMTAVPEDDPRDPSFRRSTDARVSEGTQSSDARWANQPFDVFFGGRAR